MSEKLRFFSFFPDWPWKTDSSDGPGNAVVLLRRWSLLEAFPAESGKGVFKTN
jgi:hypothetical protein